MVCSSTFIRHLHEIKISAIIILAPTCIERIVLLVSYRNDKDGLICIDELHIKIIIIIHV